MIENKARLDKTDLKLLSELDRNSRAPITRIAKKLRINQATLNFRLNRLIKENIILSFYPSIDWSKLGYMIFRVYLKFQNTSPIKEKEILDDLTKTKICTIVAELEAFYDILFMLTVKHNKEFYSFWNKFKEKYKQFISEENISVMTKVEHFKRNYLLNTNYREIEIVGNSEEIKTDEEDKKILSLLAKNCRISSLEISKSADIPARTVIYKIRQLEKKGIIQGYRVNINLEKINYNYYKINFILSDNKRLQELNSFCRHHPNIIYIDYSISKWDFEIDLEIENNKLKDFIRKLKEKFPIFKDIEIISFTKYHKIETIPQEY